MTEDEITLLVDKAVPENTKKSTSYAANVLDVKLFVQVRYDRLGSSAHCEKHLKDNNHNSHHLTLKICSDVCDRVPESSQ